MTVTAYVCLVLGALLTAWAGWERAGSSTNARAWLRTADRKKVRRALFVRPGLGVGLLAFGLVPAVQHVPVLGFVVALVAVVAVLVVLFWWGILAFPFPRWTVPGWAREQVATIEKRPWA